MCVLGRIPSNSLVIAFGDAVVVAAVHDDAAVDDVAVPFRAVTIVDV